MHSKIYISCKSKPVKLRAVLGKGFEQLERCVGSEVRGAKQAEVSESARPWV